MTHIVKSTTKGQITLPAKWRKNFTTNRFLIKEKGNTLEISPIDPNDLEDGVEWETVFSANRDNEGRGVEAKELLQLLQKMN